MQTTVSYKIQTSLNHLVSIFTDPHAVCKINSCILYPCKYPSSLLFLENRINQCVLPVSFVDQFVHHHRQFTGATSSTKFPFCDKCYRLLRLPRATACLPSPSIFSLSFHLKCILMHMQWVHSEFVIYCCLVVLAKLCRELCRKTDAE